MNSPIPYFGGKSRPAPTIVNRIPKHKTYAEVFGGAAWILFRKPSTTVEFLNDLDQLNFEEIQLPYTAQRMTGGQPLIGHELLITNYRG